MPNGQQNTIINKIYLPIVHKQKMSVNEHPQKIDDNAKRFVV
jgi:hypothetical protein